MTTPPILIYKDFDDMLQEERDPILMQILLGRDLRDIPGHKSHWDHELNRTRHYFPCAVIIEEETDEDTLEALYTILDDKTLIPEYLPPQLIDHALAKHEADEALYTRQQKKTGQWALSTITAGTGFTVAAAIHESRQEKLRDFHENTLTLGGLVLLAGLGLYYLSSRLGRRAFQAGNDAFKARIEKPKLITEWYCATIDRCMEMGFMPKNDVPKLD